MCSLNWDVQRSDSSTWSSLDLFFYSSLVLQHLFYFFGAQPSRLDYLNLCTTYAFFVHLVNNNNIEKAQGNVTEPVALVFQAQMWHDALPKTDVVHLSKRHRGLGVACHLCKCLQGVHLPSLHMQLREDHINNRVTYVNRGWLYAVRFTAVM